MSLKPQSPQPIPAEVAAWAKNTGSLIAPTAMSAIRSSVSGRTKTAPTYTIRKANPLSLQRFSHSSPSGEWAGVSAGAVV